MISFSTLRGVASTSRPLTSLLFASTGSAFLYLAHQQVYDVFRVFLITLLLSFATFTANDLIDAEQDRINHPKRFLVISPSARAASAAYYLALMGSYCVVSVDFFGRDDAWVFLVFLLIFINYSIIKISAPLFKNAYISAANIGLLWYVTTTTTGIHVNLYVAISALIFTFSREILMDIPDIDGDRDSIAKRFGPRRAWVLVTALSFVAALALGPSLLPLRTPIFALAFALPAYFLARNRLALEPMKVDSSARVLSGLPYIYCGYLIISS